MSYWGLLLVLLLAAGQQCLANVKLLTYPCEVDFFRLPTRIQPSKYRLVLELNPREESFSGPFKIDLNIRKMDPLDTLITRSISGKLHPFALDPERIILNAEDLTIDRAVFYQKGTTLKMKRLLHDANNKILVVQLIREPIVGATARLILRFKGRVQAEPKGLFWSKVNPNSWTLATHFEPAYARRLFPCFDEPEFKATFELTIVHQKVSTALSNMGSIKMVTSKDHTRTIFAPSPEMSSYMLNLAVGEFESMRKMGAKVTIYAPVRMPRTKMLDMAIQAYHEVNNFFGDLQQSEKRMDIVAVDRGPISTKNWGLITMRWNLLSASEEVIKPNGWMLGVIVLMTQMIHQRLANMVTMRWWGDQWLIDGLAANLASELTAELYPQMGSELYTLIDTTFSAMNIDDDPEKACPINGKHPRKAEQFRASFDLSTYKKSAALVRMFVRSLGKFNIKSAIRDVIEWTLSGDR